VLANILYHVGQERLADVCEYSLRNQSPTIVVRRIIRTQIGTVLNGSDSQWFLCCSASVLFLDNPLLLLDYINDNKYVYKIAGFTVSNSPITLWNNVDITPGLIDDEKTIWATCDLPQEWACSCPHPSPKGIIYQADMHPDHLELWNNYDEEAAYEHYERG
jgi:hypothetical protein